MTEQLELCPHDREAIARIINNLRSRANAAHGKAAPSETALMCAEAADLIEALAARAEPRPSTPIPRVLHCPKCGLQHIDAPDVYDNSHVTGRPVWDNPPHRSHLCLGCGHVWRPADVPTEGVAAIQTRGDADSPAPSTHDDHEAIARLAYFIVFDGLDADSAMDPGNDAHWAHWKDHFDTACCFRFADAILARRLEAPDHG